MAGRPAIDVYPRGVAGEESSEERRGNEVLLARIQTVPVYVSPTWFIVAALLTVIFEPVVADWVPGLGAWSWVVAASFVVLLYASVLVHELGHALAARAYGLPVHRITLHMLGGVTEISRADVTPGRQFVIAGIGPALSLALGVIGLLLAQALDPGSVVHLLAVQLGAANLLVGVFNLLPGLPLDGGQLLRAAVWKVSGNPGQATVAAAWVGRVVAVAVVLGPVLWSMVTNSEPDLLLIIWMALIGAFVWTGATQALRSEKIQSRLRALSVRGLARRAWPVLADTPVAEGLRRLTEGGARALVVVDHEDKPLALVSEVAVTAIPVERRPWVTVASVSRRIEPGLILALDLDGPGLLDAMRALPAEEYLVLDAEGRVFGVLAAKDVDRAFAGV